jgi:hypothetical protein
LSHYSPDDCLDDGTPKVLGVSLDNLSDTGGQMSLMEEIDEFKATRTCYASCGTFWLTLV